MARHADLRVGHDLPVYFLDPQSPWQRGTHENTNGLLRQSFPKGTDLAAMATTNSTPWPQPSTAGRDAGMEHTRNDRLRPPSSPRSSSSRCWRHARSRSAWTARGPGATTSSSNASGGRSHTKGLPAGLHPRLRGPRLNRALSRLLQQPKAPFIAGREDPRSSLLQRADGRSDRSVTEAEIHLERHPIGLAGSRKR